jgi:hypothetical protein
LQRHTLALLGKFETVMMVLRRANISRVSGENVPVKGSDIKVLWGKRYGELDLRGLSAI